MKILYILCALLIAVSACKEDTSNDYDKGFVEPPNDGTAAQNLTYEYIHDGKSYSFTTGISLSCASDCKTIISQFTSDGTDYVGIAVDNFDNDPTTDRFYLKIAYPASSIETTNIQVDPSLYTIILKYNGNLYTHTPDDINTSDDLDITIASSDSTINDLNDTEAPIRTVTIKGYQILFNSSITIDAVQFFGAGVDTIVATEYPEDLEFSAK